VTSRRSVPLVCFLMRTALVLTVNLQSRLPRHPISSGQKPTSRACCRTHQSSPIQPTRRRHGSSRTRIIQSALSSHSPNFGAEGSRSSSSKIGCEGCARLASARTATSQRTTCRPRRSGGTSAGRDPGARHGFASLWISSEHVLSLDLHGELLANRPCERRPIARLEVVSGAQSVPGRHARYRPSATWPGGLAAPSASSETSTFGEPLDWAARVQACAEAAVRLVDV
jgi:hypothetical protein